MYSTEYPQGPTIATIYRQRWGEGESPPDLEQFLDEFGSLPRTDLVEVLITDQRLRWQRPAGPSVEDYLNRFPALATDRHARLDLVYGEMLATCVLRLPLDFDAYCARFPDLREELHRQMEVTQWLSDAVRQAGNGE